MRVEDYVERAREMGIGRGQLETEFRPDLAGVGMYLEPEYVNPRASMEVLPPPIVEDLSRFGPQKPIRTPEQIAVLSLLKCKERNRKLYHSLAQRGMSVVRLANQVGLSPWQIHTAFSRRHRLPKYLPERIRPALTPAEVKLLRW